MSGVLPIKAETIQLLADNPIVGPVPTQVLVSVVPAVGLQHIPSRWILTLNNAPCQNAATAPLFTAGSTIAAAAGTSGTGRIYALPTSSALTAVSTPTFTAPTVTFPGLQYGTIEVDMQLNIIATSAAAPTFTAVQTAATISVVPTVFTTGGAVISAFEPFDQRILHCFNTGTQLEKFFFKFFIPYDAARTAVNIRFTIQNDAQAADNDISVLAASQAVFTVTS